MREFKDWITGESKDDDEAASSPELRRTDASRGPGADASRARRPRGSGRAPGPSAAPSGRSAGSTSMAKVLRPIGHEDRLSIVDHLDELRYAPDHLRGGAGRRLRLCFWQNHALLNLLNRPLPPPSQTGGQPPRRPDRATRSSAARTSPDRRRACPGARRAQPDLSAADRALLAPRRLKLGSRRPRRCPEDAQERADHDRRRRAVHDHADRAASTSRCCSRCRCCSTRYTRSSIPALSPHERRVALPSCSRRRCCS